RRRRRGGYGGRGQPAGRDRGRLRGGGGRQGAGGTGAAAGRADEPDELRGGAGGAGSATRGSEGSRRRAARAVLTGGVPAAAGDPASEDHRSRAGGCRPLRIRARLTVVLHECSISFCANVRFAQSSAGAPTISFHRRRLPSSYLKAGAFAVLRRPRSRR